METIRKTMICQKDSFRKLVDPIENGKGVKYVFYVKIDDIAEGIPMATNPREQKLTSGVAKAIEESLISNDGYFHLKNRGIVVSANSIDYDNRKNEVTLHFTDGLAHGDIDGGHTYKIMCEHKNENLNQYVQFEVMTGVEDIIEQLAEARNTSVQVDEKSMAELKNQFDPIKEGIEGMPFYNRIAFKQNQLYTDPITGKKQKMIDARDIVAIIGMFHERYTKKNHPTQAYSSKAKMLEYYLKESEEYRKFVNVIPDIFDLYEAVETEFAEAYNNTNGRYGRKKYSGYKDGAVVTKSKFSQKDMIYKVPEGLIYPTIAAFRCKLVFEKTINKYTWINNENPVDIWERVKSEVVLKIMNYANSIGDNPNAVGKDSNIWDLAYITVLISD